MAGLNHSGASIMGCIYQTMHFIFWFFFFLFRYWREPKKVKVWKSFVLEQRRSFLKRMVMDQQRRGGNRQTWTILECLLVTSQSRNVVMPCMYEYFSHILGLQKESRSFLSSSKLPSFRTRFSKVKWLTRAVDNPFSPT